MIKIPLQLSWLVLLFPSCGDKQEKTKPIRETITESVYASGIVKSKNQYKVFSLANGLIDKVLVSEGDIVKKGDGIIRLINTTAELNAENAKLSADYASVAANAEKLNELKITIELAKTKMENDDLLLQKQENLWAQQVGTQNELLQKQLASKPLLTPTKPLNCGIKDFKSKLIFKVNKPKGA